MPRHVAFDQPVVNDLEPILLREHYDPLREDGKTQVSSKGMRLVFHEAIERFMEPERGELGDQPLEGSQIRKTEDHKPIRFGRLKHVPERVAGTRKMLD